MKVAIPVAAATKEAKVDLRFGRTRFFAIVDTENNDWQFIDNSQDMQAAQGAGIQAATTVANAGAEAIIAINLGPKAIQVLQGGGIKVYTAPENVAAEAAVELLKDNQLQEMAGANVEGHWM